jgi:hypothetical protein
MKADDSDRDWRHEAFKQMECYAAVISEYDFLLEKDSSARLILVDLRMANGRLLEAVHDSEAEIADRLVLLGMELTAELYQVE